MNMEGGVSFFVLWEYQKFLYEMDISLIGIIYDYEMNISLIGIIHQIMYLMYQINLDLISIK